MIVGADVGALVELLMALPYRAVRTDPSKRLCQVALSRINVLSNFLSRVNPPHASRRTRSIAAASTLRGIISRSANWTRLTSTRDETTLSFSVSMPLHRPFLLDMTANDAVPSTTAGNLVVHRPFPPIVPTARERECPAKRMIVMIGDDARPRDDARAIILSPYKYALPVVTVTEHDVEQH